MPTGKDVKDHQSTIINYVHVTYQCHKDNHWFNRKRRWSKYELVIRIRIHHTVELGPDHKIQNRLPVYFIQTIVGFIWF